MRTCRAGDRGQVLPIVAMAILVVAGVVVVVVTFGGVIVDRATARTAADAAALAAAAEGDGAAAAVARANGGEVIGIERHGDTVEVEVAVGRATARARATVVRTVAPPRRRPTGEVGMGTGPAIVGGAWMGRRAS